MKDYFKKWHNDNYNVLHKRTIDALDTEIQNREDGDNNLQGNINTLNTKCFSTNPNDNSLQYQINVNKQSYASNSGISWSLDGGDGRGTYINVTSPVKDGIITWQDKAKIDALGTWYQIQDRSSIKDHLEFWFNPVLRLCQMSFRWDDCTKLSSTKDWKINNSALTCPWYELRPIAAATTRCTGTGTSAPIFFYITALGTVGIVSTANHSKVSLRANVMWFYRDQNVRVTLT